MLEIIDLSQEIFTGMPVFPGLPEVAITIHATHEQWDGITDSDTISPGVNRLDLGEHTGTHVDAGPDLQSSPTEMSTCFISQRFIDGGFVVQLDSRV